MTIIPESKDPTEVNALCFNGQHHTVSLATQVNHQFYKVVTKSHDIGHAQALSHDKLM